MAFSEAYDTVVVAAAVAAAAAALSPLNLHLAAATITVLYIVDAFDRVTCGIVGLALARIRVDTLVGA